MRVALIADIHGNLLALDAILAEIAGERVDQVVCLGDVALLGPRPREVVARLRELGCPCVMGNTDRWLIDAAYRERTDITGDLIRWSVAQLDDEGLAFVSAFLPRHLMALPGGLTLSCFHGSPRSDEDVISAVTPPEQLDALLADHPADLHAGGHTHVPLLRRHGEARVLNPGSVGLPGIGPGTPDLPVNQHVRWGEYALVGVADGRLSVELRRVPLDVERLLADARASGMPHVEWWETLWDTGGA